MTQELSASESTKAVSATDLYKLRSGVARQAENGPKWWGCLMRELPVGREDLGVWVTTTPLSEWGYVLSRVLDLYVYSPPQRNHPPFPSSPPLPPLSPSTTLHPKKQQAQTTCYIFVLY